MEIKRVGRVLRIPIRVKLKKDGRVVSDSTFYKRSAVRAVAERVPHDTGYIKVTYAKGFINDGEYQNDRDLFHALAAFTEKSLTDEFGGAK